jgi:TAP-like protein
MSDQYYERDPHGHYNNMIDSNVAINCVDRPYPRNVQAYAAAAKQAAQGAPHFGAGDVWGSVACAFWPVPAQTSAQPAHDHGAPPVLIIATKDDPATPYSWGVSLSHQLDGARLLTVNGAIHGAFARGAACVDNPVSTYLLTLQLPPPNSVCNP